MFTYVPGRSAARTGRPQSTTPRPTCERIAYDRDTYARRRRSRLRCPPRAAHSSRRSSAKTMSTRCASAARPRARRGAATSSRVARRSRDACARLRARRPCTPRDSARSTKTGRVARSPNGEVSTAYPSGSSGPPTSLQPRCSRPSPSGCVDPWTEPPEWNAKLPRRRGRQGRDQGKRCDVLARSSAQSTISRIGCCLLGVLGGLGRLGVMLLRHTSDARSAYAYAADPRSLAITRRYVSPRRRRAGSPGRAPRRSRGRPTRSPRRPVAPPR